MPHFIILLILYINLLNLSWVIKYLFLRNMESVAQNISKYDKKNNANVVTGDETLVYYFEPVRNVSIKYEPPKTANDQ